MRLEAHANGTERWQKYHLSAPQQGALTGQQLRRLLQSQPPPATAHGHSSLLTWPPVLSALDALDDAAPLQALAVEKKVYRSLVKTASGLQLQLEQANLVCWPLASQRVEAAAPNGEGVKLWTVALEGGKATPLQLAAAAAELLPALPPSWLTGGYPMMLERFPQLQASTPLASLL